MRVAEGRQEPQRAGESFVEHRGQTPDTWWLHSLGSSVTRGWKQATGWGAEDQLDTVCVRGGSVCHRVSLQWGRPGRVT